MDYHKKSQEIIAWIKHIVTTAGFDSIVIGMSGGIDSSLSATLAVQALGKDNVYPVLLPYGNLHPQGVIDAYDVIHYLNISEKNVMKIDITSAVDAITGQVGILDTDNDSVAIRRGNIMARVRMIYLFDTAKKLQTIVCGTENKTEHYLGYFTRFGDSASDIEPIVSLYKTEVWEMARILHIPAHIITKAPTAGLWELQTDEGELGFTYQQADKILHLAIDEKLSKEAIFAKGLEKEIVEKVLDRVKQNAFKHQLPHTYGGK